MKASADKVLGITLGDDYVIRLWVNEGTELGISGVSFDGSNDGMI